MVIPKNMKRLKTIQIRKIIDAFISLLVVFSLTVSAVMPRVVKSESVEAASMSSGLVVLPSEINPDSVGYPAAGERDPLRSMYVIVTSYSSDPYQTDSSPCYPAMNYDLCTWAEKGVVNTVAANFLPLGTQVKFPELYGDKVFVVRDRMNARYNGTNKVDIYSAVLDETGKLDPTASREAAKNFGLKHLKMEIF